MISKYINIILTLTGLAFLFYFIQNYFLSNLGGEIALVKVFWLEIVIIFWFICPLFLSLDKELNSSTRKAYKYFLINMLLRAIVELYMMYVSKNWHPYIGIGHNLFSILFSIFLYLKFIYPNKEFNIFALNFIVSFILFIPESFFAYYMLTNVISSETVYFVPPTSKHDFVLNITLIAGVTLFIWQIIFIRYWNNERT